METRVETVTAAELELHNNHLLNLRLKQPGFKEVSINNSNLLLLK